MEAADRHGSAEQRSGRVVRGRQDLYGHGTLCPGLCAGAEYRRRGVRPSNGSEAAVMTGAVNPHGALVGADGSVRFRWWAPGCQTASLEILGEPAPLPMTPLNEGWFEV